MVPGKDTVNIFVIHFDNLLDVVGYTKLPIMFVGIIGISMLAPEPMRVVCDLLSPTVYHISIKVGAIDTSVLSRLEEALETEPLLLCVGVPVPHIAAPKISLLTSLCTEIIFGCEIYQHRYLFLESSYELDELTIEVVIQPVNTLY